MRSVCHSPVIKSSSGGSGFSPMALYSRILFWADGTFSEAAAAGLFNIPNHTMKKMAGRVRPTVAWNQCASGGDLDTVYARLDEVLEQVPDICVFGSQGHNDGIYSSSYATHMVKWERNLDDLVDGLPSTSLIVVCTTLPSSNASETTGGDWATTVGDLQLAKVTALQAIHGDRIQPCDLRDGWNIATMTQDGTHPGELGGHFGGDKIYDVLNSRVESASIDTILNDNTAKTWRNANVHADYALSGTTGTKSGTVAPTGNYATGQRITNNLTNGTSVAVAVSKDAQSGYDNQIASITGTPATEATVIMDDTGSFTWTGSKPGAYFSWRIGVTIDDGAGGAPKGLTNYGLVGGSSASFGGTGANALTPYPYAIDTVIECVAVGQGSDTIIANPQFGARFDNIALDTTRLKISRPCIFQVELDEYGPMRYVAGDGILTTTNQFRMTGTGVSGSNITAATVGTVRVDPGRWAGGYASWDSASPFTIVLKKNGSTVGGAFSGGAWTYNMAGTVIAGDTIAVELTGTNGIGGETQTLNFTVI